MSEMQGSTEDRIDRLLSAVSDRVPRQNEGDGKERMIDSGRRPSLLRGEG